MHLSTIYTRLPDLLISRVNYYSKFNIKRWILCFSTEDPGPAGSDLMVPPESGSGSPVHKRTQISSYVIPVIIFFSWFVLSKIQFRSNSYLIFNLDYDKKFKCKNINLKSISKKNTDLVYLPDPDPTY